MLVKEKDERQIDKVWKKAKTEAKKQGKKRRHAKKWLAGNWLKR